MKWLVCLHVVCPHFLYYFINMLLLVTYITSGGDAFKFITIRDRMGYPCTWPASECRIFWKARGKIIGTYNNTISITGTCRYKILSLNIIVLT